MTDDERFDAQNRKVVDVINALRHEIDGRLLLSGLVAQASVQAEMLIAAKMATPEEVTDLFACGCGSAIMPSDLAPRVVVVDGKDSGTKH